jgi:2-keto-4-pentenoate hydratase/2-oxohepta-3-ene-1,7-dioic acid hydratase in catechol pathway
LNDPSLKIARFGYLGRKDYGFVDGDSIIPASTMEGDLPPDLFELISSEVLMSSPFLKSLADLTASSKTRVPMGEVRLEAPIPRPGKIVCLGRNYMEHVAESNTKPPKELMIFMKPSTAIAGPFDDVLYPSVTSQLDYEGELGVVIGKRCKKVGASEALGHVLGFLVFDDVSARDLQFGDGQWTRGKGCDTFAPTGPWITTRGEVPDASALHLRTWVNGEIRQDSTTAGMIKKVPEVISTLSQGMTLEAGDVIATGTPAGVGFHWKPEPRLLKAGDVIKIEIEGLGSIENRVVAEG